MGGAQVDSELMCMLREWDCEDAAGALAENGFRTKKKLMKMLEADISELDLSLSDRRAVKRLLKSLQVPTNGELVSTFAVFLCGLLMIVAGKPPSPEAKVRGPELLLSPLGLIIIIAWGAYKRVASLALFYWCSPAWVVHGIWIRRETIASWAWYLMKMYLFWCSGFFFFYYLFKLSTWAIGENAKWDRKVVLKDGWIITTFRNRETGQIFTTEEQEENRPDGDQNQAKAGKSGTLTIKSWVHCKILSGHSGKFKSRTRVDGRDHRLIAHIDTGNSADTKMAAYMFDAFFPLQPGSRTERKGLVYRGTTMIRGVTGHTQKLQKYSGLKVEFDGVTSARGRRIIFTMDVIRSHDDAKEIPGADFYHDLLVSNKDTKRLLDEHGHTVQVVDYSLFRASC